MNPIIWGRSGLHVHVRNRTRARDPLISRSAIAKSNTPLSDTQTNCFSAFEFVRRGPFTSLQRLGTSVRSEFGEWWKDIRQVIPPDTLSVNRTVSQSDGIETRNGSERQIQVRELMFVQGANRCTCRTCPTFDTGPSCTFDALPFKLRLFWFA